MERELCDALASDELRAASVVVFTGGPDVFSAGADVTEMRDQDPAAIIGYYRGTGDFAERVADLPQPTLSAISGWCLGGGLELALATDFRIAHPGRRVRSARGGDRDRAELRRDASPGASARARARQGADPAARPGRRRRGAAPRARHRARRRSARTGHCSWRSGSRRCRRSPCRSTRRSSTGWPTLPVARPSDWSGSPTACSPRPATPTGRWRRGSDDELSPDGDPHRRAARDPADMPGVRRPGDPADLAGRRRGRHRLAAGGVAQGGRGRPHRLHAARGSTAGRA